MPAQIGHSSLAIYINDLSENGQVLIFFFFSLLIIFVILFLLTRLKLLQKKSVSDFLFITQLYLISLIILTILIAGYWFISGYLFAIPNISWLFIFYILINSIIFGVRLTTITSIITMLLVSYYLISPQYTLSDSLYTLEFTDLVIGIIVSLSTGFVIRYYNFIIGKNSLELGEVIWKTRSRLAEKSEAESILKAINKSSLAISPGRTEFELVLKRIAKEVGSLTATRFSFIGLSDDLQNAIRLVIYSKDDLEIKEPKQFEQLKLKLHSICINIISKFKSADKINPVMFFDKENILGYDTVLVEPLILNNKIIGVMGVISNRKKNVFTLQVKRKIKLFAAHVSLAIQNAKYQEQLKLLIAERDQFFSITTHELKIPLSSIKLYAQLLKKKKTMFLTSEMLSKSISTIDQEVDRLTHLINILHDFSRFRSRKVILQKKQFSLNTICKRRIEVLRKLLPDHNIQFQELDKKVILYGDRFRIEQIITNLIVNAAKYSKIGSTITVRLEKGQRDVIFSVSDQGRGIEKEQLQRIFDAFYQVYTGNGKVKQTDGLGLGLYIVSEIVKLHKGKIWVESEVNKGSTFFVSLPTVQRRNS